MIVKQILLICNRRYMASGDEECEGTFGQGDLVHLSAAAQRKKAKAEGWTRLGGKDFCRSCSDKLAASITAIK